MIAITQKELNRPSPCDERGGSGRDGGKQLTANNATNMSSSVDTTRHNIHGLDKGDVVLCCF